MTKRKLTDPPPRNHVDVDNEELIIFTPEDNFWFEAHPNTQQREQTSIDFKIPKVF